MSFFNKLKGAIFSPFTMRALAEVIPLGRAKLELRQRRPRRMVLKNGIYVPDPDAGFYKVGEDSVVWNLITKAGRDFLHNQGYGSTGLGANGLNYIALSNDAVTEDVNSTTLSNEITANGFGRVQGTVTHVAGTNTTVIDHTFTASGNQSAQKAAVFTAAVGGTMNHVLAFDTPRSFITNDQLIFTLTITLG